MAMLTGEWLEAMQEEFHQPYYRELYQFVKDEYSTTQIFPPADDIFNAMHFTPLDKVKVLLLGQDQCEPGARAEFLGASEPDEAAALPAEHIQRTAGGSRMLYSQ